MICLIGNDHKDKENNMIERHWKGIAKEAMAGDYMLHLKNDTFQRLKSITGFLSAKILTRHVAEGIEFLIVTTWQDENAIKAFAGPDMETAVVPMVVRDMMVSYSKHAQHYSIAFEVS